MKDYFYEVPAKVITPADVYGKCEMGKSFLNRPEVKIC